MVVMKWTQRGGWPRAWGSGQGSGIFEAPRVGVGKACRVSFGATLGQADRDFKRYTKWILNSVKKALETDSADISQSNIRLFVIG